VIRLLVARSSFSRRLQRPIRLVALVASVYKRYGLNFTSSLRIERINISMENSTAD
jgi:hypothetical protein